MATYTIIVDDRDPGIVYSPQRVDPSGSQLDGWLQTQGMHLVVRLQYRRHNAEKLTEASYTYLETVTRSGLNGSTLKYTFLGKIGLCSCPFTSFNTRLV